MVHLILLIHLTDFVSDFLIYKFQMLEDVKDFRAGWSNLIYYKLYLHKPFMGNASCATDAIKRRELTYGLLNKIHMFHLL